jgi:secreted trypsin-like serine protease
LNPPEIDNSKFNLDSGGGLMCQNQISGIVSFGFGCGRRNFPGAYVDVSRYNNWISDCVNSNLEHDDIPRPSTISPK